MSDTAAPAVAPPAVPAPVSQPGTTPPATGAKPAAQKPTEAPASKFKVGDEEYTEGELKALVSRGKEGAKLMSAAAKKAAEADRIKAEAEAQVAVFRSGDPAKVREELRKLGYDTRAMSEAEIKEAIKDEMLSPEQKRLKELEEKLSAKERAEQEQKDKETESVRAKEIEATRDTLAKTFVGAMEAKGIPLNHARRLLPEYAQLVRSYDAMGVAPDDIPLDVIAEHLSEVDKSTFKRHLGERPVEEILSELGPEKERELVNLAVRRFKEGRKEKTGGILPGSTPARPSTVGALPDWLAGAPASVRNAYLTSDESHPDVRAYLEKKKR